MVKQVATEKKKKEKSSAPASTKKKSSSKTVNLARRHLFTGSGAKRLAARYGVPIIGNDAMSTLDHIAVLMVQEIAASAAALANGFHKRTITRAIFRLALDKGMNIQLISTSNKKQLKHKKTTKKSDDIAPVAATENSSD